MGDGRNKNITMQDQKDANLPSSTFLIPIVLDNTSTTLVVVEHETWRMEASLLLDVVWVEQIMKMPRTGGSMAQKNVVHCMILIHISTITACAGTATQHASADTDRFLSLMLY